MYLIVLQAQAAISLALGTVALDSQLNLAAFFYGFAGHVFSIAVGIVGLYCASQRAASEFVRWSAARVKRSAFMMGLSTVNALTGATLGWAAMHGPGLAIAGNTAVVGTLMSTPLVTLLTFIFFSRQRREAPSSLMLAHKA